MAIEGRKQHVRMDPKERKAQLLAAGVALAQKYGATNVTRRMIAEKTKTTDGLITRYFGNVTKLAKAITTEAAKRKVVLVTDPDKLETIRKKLFDATHPHLKQIAEAKKINKAPAKKAATKKAAKKAIKKPAKKTVHADKAKPASVSEAPTKKGGKALARERGTAKAKATKDAAKKSPAPGKVLKVSRKTTAEVDRAAAGMPPLPPPPPLPPLPA